MPPSLAWPWLSLLGPGSDMPQLPSMPASAGLAYGCTPEAHIDTNTDATTSRIPSLVTFSQFSQRLSFPSPRLIFWEILASVHLPVFCVVHWISAPGP